MKKYLLLILDGAGDLARFNGLTPLQLSKLDNINKLSSKGFGGLMETLYDDLPKGSIVAQLGILGYDPYKYYPNGRASCEGLALGITMDKNDVAFRANLSQIDGDILRSFNANYIKSELSKPLIKKLNSKLSQSFPDFELHHNSDFRNTLIIRNSDIPATEFQCIEPHENMGKEFNFSHLVSSDSSNGSETLRRLNSYVLKTKEILAGEKANIIFPWSPSSNLNLPKFTLPFPGKSAIIAHMDFLKGIAISSGIDFFQRGNGNWDTDYNSKLEKIIELFDNGYSFVYCHVNGPDEASHMGDVQKKKYSLEMSDKKIVEPIISYFDKDPSSLGGILVTTDHFTNLHAINLQRIEAHSKNPVPFIIYDGNEKDDMNSFSEDGAILGKYGNEIINHLDLLKLLFRSNQ